MATQDALGTGPTSRARPGQVPGLDGVRAIATISVFLFHASWRSPALRPLSPVLGHADIGVEVFFILSGFLVARPLVAHAVAGGRRVGPVDFWRRRIARIFPAYLVALVGAVLIGVGTVDGVSGWVKHGLLLDSWFEDGSGSGLRASWTLVVELAFYVLILPVAALVALTRRRAHDAWVGLCLVMFTFGAFAIVDVSYGVTALQLRVLPPFLPSFAAGMLLAAAEFEPAPGAVFGPFVRGIRRLAAHPVVCTGLAAAIFVTMVVGLRPSPTAPAFGYGFERTAQSFGQVAVGFLAIAPLALRTARAPWLDHRVLLAIAAASYGLYLWHLQVLRLARPLLQGPWVVALIGLVIAFAAAFVAGDLSRRFIERPARRALTR